MRERKRERERERERGRERGGERERKDTHLIITSGSHHEIQNKCHIYYVTSFTNEYSWQN